MNFAKTLFSDESHCTQRHTETSGSSGVYFVQYQYHPNASNRNLSLLWNNDLIKWSGSNLSANGFQGVDGTRPNPWIYSYPASGAGAATGLNGVEWYFQPTHLVSTSTSGDYTYYNFEFKYCHPRILPYYRNTLQIEDATDGDFNDFIIYLLPGSDAYFTGPDDYMSSNDSAAPTTVVRDGSGSNPPSYNINWGNGSQQGAPTMSKFSGWGLRANSPGQVLFRFSRSADYCIRALFFKPNSTTGGDSNEIVTIMYTYDNKIEDFSPTVTESLWGAIDASHTYELNLQQGLGASNESCTGSGNSTCDQCNAFGVEQISGTWKWGTVSTSNARVRIRSTPPASIPAANFP